MTQEGPRYHALLVGIDAYARRPLAGCVNDIDAMQRLLIERAKIPPAHIQRLASPSPGATCETSVPAAPATLANLKAALARLAAEARRGDRVFIYYSGHGTRAAIAHPDGYTTYREALVPVDVDAGPELQLLFDHELNGLLAAIPGSVTCILDCCNSAGITRDSRPDAEPSPTARYLDLERDLGWRGPLPPPALGATRGGDRAPPPEDCHVVTACLDQEQAIEVPGDDGVRHGLLTTTLLRALAGVPDDELRTVPWSRIWQAMRASVEQHNPRQHLWMAGHPGRAVLAGPPADGDPGLAIRRAGDAYELDAGTLAAVTAGALVAVYGERPARFPALGSSEDLEARRGLLRVTSADPASAAAVAEGAPFELPPGARGRVALPGAAERLRCAIAPRTEALAAALKRSPLLELVDDARLSRVRLEQVGGRWLLADDVHDAHPDRALFAVEADAPAHAVAVLEHYHRYALPLRMAEAAGDPAGDLHGKLRVAVLACERELSPKEAQEVHLPEAPTLAPSAYDLRPGARVCIRVQNTSSALLRVTLLSSSASGKVQLAGDQVIDAHGAFVFWANSIIGQPFEMLLPAGRRQGIDRLAAIGTTALGKDLGYLRVDQGFADAIAGLPPTATPKDLGAPRSAVPADRWTAATAIIKTSVA